MSLGHLCLVLHAHLPFVRHPEHEDCLEEGWLHEAIVETYIPLLWELEALADEGIDFRITLSLSPTLVAMLCDPLLKRRFTRHLDRLCDLSEREVFRTRLLADFHPTALFYRDRLARVRRDYQGLWRGDLVGAFRALSQSGKVELVTCAATHGYLPLLSPNPVAVRAQILVAVAQHRERLGAPPRGFWLPECGYTPGLDAFLQKAGVRYTFLETHAVDHASGRPRRGVHAPVFCPGGVAVFGRDPESTKQVWSSREGYPGDADYREYYRDIGFDLDPADLGACAHPLGIRQNVGIKYHRVTGPTEKKEPYVRERALARAREHARHFAESRRAQVRALSDATQPLPVVVAPYDAELFGHWWFEGPEWLGMVLRELSRDPRVVNLLTPSEYLAAYPTQEVARPSPSSWGYQGYSEMWLNGKNDWIYPHLHQAADQMVELAQAHPKPSHLERRVLNQAARELLLAQASDWAFIMTQGTVVEYAVRRTKDHLSRFQRLAGMLAQSAVDPEDLSAIEAQDNLFSSIDYRVYRADRGSGPPEIGRG